MNLRDFIINFAENHQIKHIDDISEGTIKQAITNDVYLVSNVEVTQ
jgi:hypothetical protein